MVEIDETHLIDANLPLDKARVKQIPRRMQLLIFIQIELIINYIQKAY